jgi:hypothetical protein
VICFQAEDDDTDEADDDADDSKSEAKDDTSAKEDAAAGLDDDVKVRLSSMISLRSNAPFFFPNVNCIHSSAFWFFGRMSFEEILMQ